MLDNPGEVRGRQVIDFAAGSGIASLAAFCRKHKVELVVMEATGGYEKLPFLLLSADGIGCAVARRAHYGFDMRVVGTDARPLCKPEYVAELREPAWFPEMARQVDVLVAAAPLTPQTEGMFDESVFRAMKPTAYFLALSRGRLFDEMAKLGGQTIFGSFFLSMLGISRGTYIGDYDRPAS